MRFHTELDAKSNRWLVCDAANKYRIVGVHGSATLAALDAQKREQDSFMEKYARATKPKINA